jgi:hypothetical protein
MADFADILRHGKKRFETKDKKGKWGVCEYCDKRRLLFPYRDSKKELWLLCSGCTNIFIKEEE